MHFEVTVHKGGRARLLVWVKLTNSISWANLKSQWRNAVQKPLGKKRKKKLSRNHGLYFNCSVWTANNRGYLWHIPLFHDYNAHSLLRYREGHLTIGENTILKDWFKIPQLNHSNVLWAVSYYQEPSAAQAFPPLPSLRVKAQRINSLWNPSAPFPALKCFCRGTAWRPLRQSAPRHSICLLSSVYLITEKKAWGYSARNQTLQDVG